MCHAHRSIIHITKTKKLSKINENMVNVYIIYIMVIDILKCLNQFMIYFDFFLRFDCIVFIVINNKCIILPSYGHYFLILLIIECGMVSTL